LPAMRAGARKRKTCRREVPGHDGEDDAERVPADDGVERWGVDRLRREDAGSVPGVKAAGGGALGDFGAALRDGLAHLGR